MTVAQAEETQIDWQVRVAMAVSELVSSALVLVARDEALAAHVHSLVGYVVCNLLIRSVAEHVEVLRTFARSHAQVAHAP